MSDEYNYEKEYEFAEGGWDAEKVAVFKDEFFEFIKHVKINSKEKGQITVGDHVYRAQQKFLDTIFDGLSNDIHDFKVLKSRQLGISTISRALTLFWIGIHPGMKGYMVYDTGEHREEARLELVAMIESLPASLGFPVIARQNRTLLALSNGSTMTFASAGVRESKSSGTLGRSSGINFVHASEMCSWNNVEGLESFKNALAEEFPDRLFIWESTARGFNQWHDMWEEAVEDKNHQVALFLGWFMKNNQQIRRSDPDFEKYGIQPPSEKESEMIVAVKTESKWDITPEQLAWYRRKMDPLAKAEGDAPAEFEGDVLKMQEQPSTAEEAFQMTGATFFEPLDLTRIATKHVSSRFQTYSFTPGLEFTACRVHKAHNAKSVQLKVWEEPDPDGIYVIAADPAHGANETNDRSAVQVLRCYADCVEQVAEYAWPLINTRQFAWVIAALLGWYSECYFILELNGPGKSVLQEIQSLRFQLERGYLRAESQEKGLANIFGNVKQYLYTRVDSMSAGRNLHFVTTGPLKVLVMERLRDFVGADKVILRSMDTVEEMKSIARDGDSIEAAGAKKDDRVMTMALGINMWESRVRKQMSALSRTRDFEISKKRMTITDQAAMFQQHQITSFFATKAGARKRAAISANRDAWRRGVRR